MTGPQFAPLLMTVDDFARLHGLSSTTVRECIAGRSDAYPPLKTKRTRTGRKRVYITAEAAAEWRAALDDN
ncbi:hypothetical protein [Schaalia cardiffensis]|uniref:hypothetical protein n=1 Tax=Schaalia cardiffensis TaxID=181487 RepID=UPI0023F05379|nr:hypothetical protein [Schaalia cardiffensis]